MVTLLLLEAAIEAPGTTPDVGRAGGGTAAGVEGRGGGMALKLPEVVRGGAEDGGTLAGTVPLTRPGACDFCA